MGHELNVQSLCSEPQADFISSMTAWRAPSEQRQAASPVLQVVLERRVRIYFLSVLLLSQ